MDIITASISVITVVYWWLPESRHRFDYSIEAAAAARTSSFFESTGYPQAYVITFFKNWNFVYLRVKLCLWRYFCVFYKQYILPLIWIWLSCRLTP